MFSARRPFTVSVFRYQFFNVVRFLGHQSGQGARHSLIVTREAVRLTVIERTLNGEKAKRVLGYRPKVSIGEGLERTGKWFVDEAKRAGEGKTA